MGYAFAAGFLFGAVALALAGNLALASIRKKRGTWLPAAGTVIDLAETSGELEDDEGPLYAPVYRYVVDGTSYTGTSPIAARPSNYKVGDPISVLVNPADPARSDVVQGTSLFIMAAFALALLCLVVALVAVWLARMGVTFE
jgi:hypothetical protein